MKGWCCLRHELSPWCPKYDRAPLYLFGGSVTSRKHLAAWGGGVREGKCVTGLSELQPSWSHLNLTKPRPSGFQRVFWTHSDENGRSVLCTLECRSQGGTEHTHRDRVVLDHVQLGVVCINLCGCCQLQSLESRLEHRIKTFHPCSSKHRKAGLFKVV